MANKKTYRDYKEIGNVKFPAVAWILDRSIIYVAMLLVALFVIGTFMKMGWDSYQEVIKAPEIITPYQDIEPVSSVGKTWAGQLITKNPAELPEWLVDESSKPRPVIDPKTCPEAGEIPTNLLSTHVATSPGVEVKIHVYGAGQAAQQFSEYVTSLTSCFVDLSTDVSGKTTFAVFPQGFILTAGDAIISVSSVDDLTRDSLLDFYLKNLEPSLVDSKCLSLDSAPTDATRNPFYNKDQYTGLDESVTLRSAVDHTNLPTPTSLQMNEIADPEAITPEAPLPATFPKLPKDEETKPEIPGSPKDQTEFTGVAKYSILDTKGPGCGWAWAAQMSPELNPQDLRTEKITALQTAQTTVDGTATNYVNGKINWALQVASLAPRVDSWNTFVNQTNYVHEKWAWLDVERQKLEIPWFQYVADHDEWSTFDQRKAEALRQFDEEFKQCQVAEKELEDWDKKWQPILDKHAEEMEQYESDLAAAEEKAAEEQAKAEADRLAEEKAKKEDDEKKPSPSAKPSATPSPSASPSATPSIPKPKELEDIPLRPEGCSTPPEEPLIASQDKPAEPQAPFIPAEVTIPASWPTPKN